MSANAPFSEVVVNEVVGSAPGVWAVSGSSSGMVTSVPSIGCCMGEVYPGPRCRVARGSAPKMVRLRHDTDPAPDLLCRNPFR